MDRTEWDESEAVDVRAAESRERQAATLDRLLRELPATGPGAGPADEAPDAAPPFADVEPLTSRIGFEEGRIVAALDAVLVLLVDAHETGVHGTALMDDLARLFDVRLSPGTVYPRLHDLVDDGLFEVHERVRTKDYTIADRERATELLESELRQHLALGYVLVATVEES
jgi:hypothetical protein